MVEFSTKGAVEKPAASYDYYDVVEDLAKKDRWRRWSRSLSLAAIYLAISLAMGYVFGMIALFFCLIVVCSGIVPLMHVVTPRAYIVAGNFIIWGPGGLGRKERLELDGDLKAILKEDRNLVEIKSKWVTILYLYSHDPKTLHKILERKIKVSRRKK
ncbi:MAG: hypothetical protein DSO07_05810 [Thermoproteota archaeon]|nr:hypothetical protein D6D85_14725 [Candidatus Methanodesulfokores washburnensis]TDA41204.1 MAG: hypothetical protein DSO07_05810 [Candidatus Korarchaeota archaeon]